MKIISKSEFDLIFPTLEEIYNHSNHQVKLWEGTVHKKIIVDNWKKEVSLYWKYNQKK